MIELLYATGLRVSELVALRPADLHLEAGYSRRPARGASSGWCRSATRRAAWVARYLREARPALLGRRTSPRLFVNARGGPGMTRVGFWKILQGIRRAARARASR